VDEIKMAMSDYYKKSQSVDIRHRYLDPLRKYNILSAEYTQRENPRYYYDRIDGYRYSHPSEESFQIEFEKQGLEKLLGKLDALEREEYLRKEYPALQNAWEQYQLVLELMK
jgi:FMN phosphatase YigB (HAD superfamily)